MTVKLYYEDSYLQKFNAVILSCKRCPEGGYEIILDKTAFFPCGGGQESDTGMLSTSRVLSVREENGTIFHLVDKPLEIGKTVVGTIDWSQRFRRMQNHTGEHLVSGIVHSLYGFDNIGFHMGSSCVTVDFNGVLMPEMAKKVENIANRVVCKNVGINIIYPDAFTAERLNYRSKKEIDKDLRLVEIDGYDLCACCAPHLSSTGSIGIIKFLDVENYKGGTRCSIVCGLDAYDDICAKYAGNTRISNLLSAKPNETAAAVERLMSEQSSLKAEIAVLKKELALSKADSLLPSNGNICSFVTGFDIDSLRCIVNKGMTICNGMCAAFSGDDENGYIYVVGSETINMAEKAREINSALSGRGGGSTTMIQGSVNAANAEIKAFFNI